MSVSSVGTSLESLCHPRPSSEGFCEATKNVALATLNECRFHCSKARTLIRHGLQGLPSEYMDPKTDAYDWKEGCRGLCLMVDGLFGPREILEPQRQRFVERSTDLDIKLPQVPFNGNCAVAIAVEPILKMVLDYQSRFPSNPICLIGVSNGGRIVAELELALRRYPSVVKVSTIAGALLGTRLVDNLMRTGLTPLVLDPVLQEELQYGSANALDRLERQREDLPEGVVRHFTYYVAAQETHIFPFTSSMPDIGKGEDVRVIQGQTHCSLSYAIAEEQVDDCLSWIATASSPT
ncbi:MAG: hypothetical protein KDK78_11005 [Chlamydiia bacterium]|nr:hypothetical protein [Chlamydiia bacterium]